MRVAVLAIGDARLGFPAALRDAFPTTKTQPCWVHEVANVLASLQTSAY